MIVTELGASADGARSIEVDCREISFHALLRHMRCLPGAKVSRTSINPMNDDARASILYKNSLIQLDTPFSDYVLSCDAAGREFEEFLDHLRRYKAKWWERFV